MASLKKYCQLLLLGLLLGFSSFSQYNLQDTLPHDPYVRIGKLSNGLTYYIRKNLKPEKKVELRLVVNAGSVLENDDQQGLAHFMEHMGFNGSKHFPKNELVSFLQKAGVKFGADLNAYTSFDETVYILPVPTEDPTMVENGFTILEDWAFNNLMDPAEIEKERGVVLEESRLRKGSFERMSRQYFPLLFNGSKYGKRLPIGKDEVLKNFKPQVLKAFYKNWYRPNLMAVIVVGDIDPDEAEKKIRDHFAKYTNPAGAPQRPSTLPVKDRTKAEAMVLTDDEATNTILQVYNFIKPSQRINTWSDFRANMIEGLISSMINQRLSELTQKENAPFLFANTSYTPFVRGYSSFNSFAVLGKSTVTEAINALVEETQRARQHGFLSSELERAKKELLNQIENATKEVGKVESSQLVTGYVNHFLTGSPIPGPANRMNFLKKSLPELSISEVNEMAKKMPSVENAFTLLQAPTNKKDELPDNEKLLTALTAAAARPVKAYEETAVAATLMDKLPTPGKTIGSLVNEKLGTIEYTLSNGITIQVKPTTLKNDEITMDGWRWGGYHKFPAKDKHNALLATPLISQMGIKDMSAIELRKFMSGKTLSVSPYSNPDEEGIEGSSSIKDFETFLQLVHLYFTQPRRDDKLFNTLRISQRAALQFLGNDPNTSFQDTLQKIIYDNHPWLITIPKPADFDALSLDRIMEIYNQMYGNAYGMHFSFVGNIDTAQARPLFEKYLGSLPSSPKENTYTDIGMRLAKGRTEVVLKRGKEKKATISLQFEGETEYTRENRLKLAALLDVLNIQITEKLREDMGGIYTGRISGNILKRPWEHYSIYASIPCGPENVEKLSAALIKLINDAREKGIEQKDLDKVKENWKKQHHVNLQSNDFWLTHLSNSYINQDNPENILDYEQKIQTLTVKDLQDAARKYLTLDNMVKAVMMPESSEVKEEVKKEKKGF